MASVMIVALMWSKARVCSSVAGKPCSSKLSKNLDAISSVPADPGPPNTSAGMLAARRSYSSCWPLAHVAAQYLYQML